MNNVYAAPQAGMSDVPTGEEFYEPQLLSFSGRIGRLRYLSYSFVAMVFLYLILGLVTIFTGGTFGSTGGTPERINALTFVPLIIITALISIECIILAVRRLNDMDNSGWLCLLLFLPLVGFIFWLYLILGSGTKEKNRYGLPPSQNSIWIVIGAMCLIISVLSVFVAIALPAYKDYTNRARAAQQQHLPAQPAEPELPTPAQ